MQMFAPTLQVGTGHCLPGKTFREAEKLEMERGHVVQTGRLKWVSRCIQIDGID